MCIVLFEIILFLLAAAVYGKRYQRSDVEAEPAEHLVGKYTYGEWDSYVYCNEGEYVSGFWLFFDNAGGDDEGAVSVTLLCRDPKKLSQTAELVASDDWDRGLIGNNYGVWGYVDCDYANGETIKGFRAIDGYSDDYGMINMQAICTNNGVITPHDGVWNTYFPDTSWYDYGTWSFCPSGFAVCGYKQQIDVLSNHNWSGINQLKFKCCALPSKIPKGCKTTDIDIDDSQNFMADLTVRGDYYEPVIFNNFAAVESELATLSFTKCDEEITTFKHTSGEELSFKIGVSTSMEANWNAVIASGSLSVKRSFDFSSTYSEHFEKSTENKKTVCSTKPSEAYKCPARTRCERSFLVLVSSSNTFPMTLTAECDDGKTRTIKGEFTTKGANKILVKDSHYPLDCIYYTNDYGNRWNGKLPFCDTCLKDGDKTNECHVCRDFSLLLDGQCIERAECETICGGIAKGDNVGGIHSTVPFSGGYCDIDNKETNIEYKSKECQLLLNKSLPPTTSPTTSPTSTSTSTSLPPTSIYERADVIKGADGNPLEHIIGTYDYGKWETKQVYCDDGEFASGINLFFDNQAGLFGDDEAAISVTLLCRNPNDRIMEYEELKSDNYDIAVSKDAGIWEAANCDYANGKSIKGFKSLDGTSSSYGMVNIKALCTDNQEIMPHTNLMNTVWKGYYTENDKYNICGDGSAICGYKQSIDPTGFFEDDTGLNRVAFYCCPLF